METTTTTMAQEKMAPTTVRMVPAQMELAEPPVAMGMVRATAIPITAHPILVRPTARMLLPVVLVRKALAPTLTLLPGAMDRPTVAIPIRIQALRMERGAQVALPPEGGPILIQDQPMGILEATELETLIRTLAIMVPTAMVPTTMVLAPTTLILPTERTAGLEALIRTPAMVPKVMALTLMPPPEKMEREIQSDPAIIQAQAGTEEKEMDPLKMEQILDKTEGMEETLPEARLPADRIVITMV
mmetsp:Transcript_33381/g.98423  ORF Transcript_33381/g.98423 Transcript_33381/m.98423 type:complete len:244 (-) Transcript_33381:1785-2516(-)